jgi:hypothetical protein
MNGRRPDVEITAGQVAQHYFASFPRDVRHSWLLFAFMP